MNSLSDDERKDYQFFRSRIEELKQTKRTQYGIDIEQIWADADKDYIPHRLNAIGRKFVTTDEDKGWRGTNLRVLEPNDWRADFSKPNPFIKIQTALSILVDQNPTGVFSPSAKQFQATTTLMQQLYSRSWEYARSKQQLKLFVFNLSKYGWAIARTYPLRIVRDVKNIVSYNEENPEKSVWEKKEVEEFNDIFRENIDPWNAWIDDMAKPNNNFTIRDWVWRKVYSMDSAEEEFGKYSNWKFVKPGGVTTERINGPTTQSSPQKKYLDKNLVEVYFYENRLKDLFIVEAGGIPIIIEPLPISDSKGNKKLSCWQTYWNLRSAECPFGIGVYEAIRYDQAVLDTIRNSTVDQLLLSINKMFFFQGTGQLQETGDIKIRPGIGKQVLDPKNINWLQVPGPGAEAWQGIELFSADVDRSSGISETLEGTISGKTAFEIAQAKESALKRLKTPLDNITDALTDEAYITISLAQLLYSVPEVHEVVDDTLIADYLNEIQSDPELYERDKNGTFQAKVYREFPLNMDKDEKGNLIETQDTRFFRIKPRFLKWEGVIAVKAQSVLTPSKQVDKALELEMFNMLIPLIGNAAVMGPMGVETYSKLAVAICKLYDKDPKEILPDSWTNPQPLQIGTPDPSQPLSQGQPLVTPQPLIVPSGQPSQPSAGFPAPNAPKLVDNTRLVGANPKGQAGKIISKVSRPFT